MVHVPDVLTVLGNRERLAQLACYSPDLLEDFGVDWEDAVWELVWYQFLPTYGGYDSAKFRRYCTFVVQRQGALAQFQFRRDSSVVLGDKVEAY